VIGLALALQVVSPLALPGAVNTANLATKAEVAAVAAAVPVPSSTVPPAEVIGGAVGSQMVFRRADDVQPRITRAAPCTTVAAGTCSVTWPVMPAVPLVIPVPTIASTAAQAPLCFPVTGSITTTGATIKCFTSQSVTVSLLGAVVAPITTAAAGVPVQVFAVPFSQ
jgi:hypothetical protein